MRYKEGRCTGYMHTLQEDWACCTRKGAAQDTCTGECDLYGPPRACMEHLLGTQMLAQRCSEEHSTIPCMHYGEEHSTILCD